MTTITFEWDSELKVKDERNDYKIINAGGKVDKLYNNEGKLSFDNDNPRSVGEYFRCEQGETFRVSESFDLSQEEFFEATNETGGGDLPDFSSASSASSISSASSAASSVASVASTAGSGLGAMAGMLASGVATAVLVVAVFVSTLVMNLSLVMSDMHSLVFELKMQGAQAEDFEDPIWAILTASDGTYLEQEVKQDTVKLAFYDLQPNTEYLIRIGNSQKIFVEKTYITPKESTDKGSLITALLNGEYVVYVKNAKLDRGEFYTVTAKDAKGKVVFSKDGMDADAEYRFTLAEPRSLYFSLSVGGKTYAISQIEWEAEPQPNLEPAAEYDFTNGVWAWDDFDSATVTFPETHGGESLVLVASVTSEPISEPTCEVGGKREHTATAHYGDEVYQNKRTEETVAYGHDYVFYESTNAACETPGTEEHYQCSQCGKYFDMVKSEVSETSLIVSPLGHDYGEWILGTPATSATEENGTLPHYECSRCEKCFNADHEELDTIHYCLVYDYSNPEWSWGRDLGGALDGTATVCFTEIHGDGSVVLEASVVKYQKSAATCESPAIKFYNADTADYDYISPLLSSESETFEEGEALGHDCGDLIPGTWTCETGGTVDHFECGRCHKLFDLEEVEIPEEELILPAGHTLGDLFPEEPADCVTSGFAAHYQCTICEKYFDVNGQKVEEEDLILPPLATGFDLQVVTYWEVSSELIGSRVYLRTYDGAAGVKIGALNNTATNVDAAELTAFVVTEVDEDGVVLYYEEGGRYLSINNGGSVSFDSETPNAILVGEAGDLSADGLYFFYDSVADSIIMTEESNELFVNMYLILPAGHTYGEWIEENADGNGLEAHFECEVCHKLFDEEYEETTKGDLALANVSLSETSLHISPTGYAGSEDGLADSTPFVSSAEHPYVIREEVIEGCDNIINVYQNDQNETTDVYIVLHNVSIQASEWCSLFRIVATNTLNVHLIVKGSAYFSVQGQSVFSSQGGSLSTVNILIDQSGGTFIAEYEGSGSALAGSAENSGEINVIYV